MKRKSRASRRYLITGIIALGAMLSGGMAFLAASLPAWGQGLIPDDFFSAPVDSNAPVNVEADTLRYDASANTITAQGDVVLTGSGYKLMGQNLVYFRDSQALNFVGAVTVQDPSGNRTEMHDLNVTGSFKTAYIQALTITTYDGARITADSADYDKALQTVMNNASYAPCGDCVDSAGRRIGWSVKARRFIYNAENGSLYLDQPSLTVLGIPLAWLPFLWLPDTSKTFLDSLRTPAFYYEEKTGYVVSIPYYAHSSRWSTLILTPTLLSQQGFLLGIEWQQRFDNGTFTLSASGLHQGTPSAFSFPDAQRDWRGAIQTAGTFRPIADWTAGWSYTAFTDAAYLNDYRLDPGKSAIDQVYMTHIGRNTYFDARMQRFNLLGNYTQADQGVQGRALPALRFEHVQELAPGSGRIDISARMLGVYRNHDALNTAGNGYNFGYAGSKQHASLQLGWQNQWIGGGGFVATPYIGGRTDIASYDGASLLQPDATTLWSTTPIAAMDVRFPFTASVGSTVHLAEPIVQAIYRGTNTSLVGLHNDDAQSFVFDDTNLFSYNRFSGNDRQETGLRTNIGGRYQINFADSSHAEIVAGQSFHLAGSNAFSNIDHAQTNVGGGLENTASYAVLGAYASLKQGLAFGGKMQVNTGSPGIERAGIEARQTLNGYATSLHYIYEKQIPALGMTTDRHEIGTTLTIPVADYWSVQTNAYWDIAANSWLQAGGGLTYDDGYAVISAEATRTGPTHIGANDFRVMATFRLKAPAGLDIGYSGNLPIPSF